MALDLLEALERLLAEASHPGRGPLSQLGVILRPPGSFGRPQCVGLPSQLDLALGQLDQKCRALPVVDHLVDLGNYLGRIRNHDSMSSHNIFRMRCRDECTILVYEW